MLQNRLELIIFLLLIIACIITTIGLEKQFQERKKQFICQGNLHQWWIYWNIYRHESPSMSKQLSPQEMITTLETYCYDGKLPCCPEHEHGYQANAQTLPAYFTQNPLAAKSVLMCDGTSNLFWQDSLFLDVDYRHLGNANILLGDGTVVPYQNSSKELDHNYRWSFP